MTNPVLTLSDRFLLASISSWEGPEAQELQQASFSWGEVVQAARRNRIAGFAAQRALDPKLSGPLPSQAETDWLQAQQEAQQRSQASLRQVRDIGSLLHQVGVRSMLYKGPDFESRCGYSESCPRSYSDFDVIVRPADIDKATSVLFQSGYRLPPGAFPLDYYRRFHLHAIFLHQNRFEDPDKALPVEVHWALDSPYARVPNALPLLFDSCEGAEEFGPGYLRPHAVDALGLMVLHFEKHLDLSATLGTPETRLKSVIDDKGLVWLVDILFWFRQFADHSSPESVLRRLHELGATRALVITLRLANDLEPSALPAWAGELAERLPQGRPLMSRLVYPDLSAGKAPNSRGRLVRAFMFREVPALGFRPVRLLEAAIPRFEVPGAVVPVAGTRMRAALSRLSLALSNVFSVFSIKTKRVLGLSRSPEETTLHQDA